MRQPLLTSTTSYQSLRNHANDDLTVTKRRVHTLKGNAGIYGLERVAAACHTIEDHIADTGELPESQCWTTLFGRWAAVRGNVRRIIGEREGGISLSEQEYAKLGGGANDGTGRVRMLLQPGSQNQSR